MKDIKGVRMRGDLLSLIDTNGVIMVTDELMDIAFPAPKRLYPFKTLALTMSGCRPDETQEEVINHFCTVYKLSYWKSPDYSEHPQTHFFKKL